MKLNLLRDAWLPVVRRSGQRDVIRVADIAERDDHPDPCVRVSLGRADLDANLVIFLIGVLYTASPPSSRAEAIRRIGSPPRPEELQEAFERIAPAFELYGPRAFLQDPSVSVKGAGNRIQQLLIDAPGDSTLKLNMDLFHRAERIPALGPAATAAALFTQQTNAPSGGQGHRTSMRGGGPLNCLVLDDDPEHDTLWKLVCRNVPDLDMMRGDDPRRTPLEVLFPWMGTIPTSSKGEQLLPSDGHPAWIFWATPRRVLLQPPTDGVCALTGEAGPVFEAYHTQNYGMNMPSELWPHPLTPRYRPRSAVSELLPVLTPKGGYTYRHWPGVGGPRTETTAPAAILDRWRHLDRVRLWVFGYDMDNMKARAWAEARAPVVRPPADEGQLQDFAARVHGLTDAASEVGRTLESLVREALFHPSRQETVKNVELSDLRAAFWQRTEGAFYAAVEELRDALERHEDTTPATERFLFALQKAARTLFEDRVMQSGDIGSGEIRRVVTAANKLQMRVSPRNPLLRKRVHLAPVQPSPGA